MLLGMGLDFLGHFGGLGWRPFFVSSVFQPDQTLEFDLGFPLLEDGID
jgi:hypothetical protein